MYTMCFHLQKEGTQLSIQSE